VPLLNPAEDNEISVHSIRGFLEANLNGVTRPPSLRYSYGSVIDDGQLNNTPSHELGHNQLNGPQVARSAPDDQDHSGIGGNLMNLNAPCLRLPPVKHCP